MRLQESCFKIDRVNAKAMIHGFRKGGQHYRTAIWLSVRDGRFPALITLQRSRTPFQPSRIGRAMDPDNYVIPLKYIATLDSQYFVRNEMPLWEELCSNGLFDVWEPTEPYRRFAEARSNPAKYRIQLLRIYEIDHEFKPTDVKPASTRIDKLVPYDREVELTRAVIDDVDFSRIKALLQESTRPYLGRDAWPR